MIRTVVSANVVSLQPSSMPCITLAAIGAQLPFSIRPIFRPRKPRSGRTYITSQNHGYAVVAGSLKGTGTESFRNANDGSCEGMDYPDLNCFTVQFHPEAASGPRDTAVLFDRFVERMMKNA